MRTAIAFAPQLPTAAPRRKAIGQSRLAGQGEAEAVVLRRTSASRKSRLFRDGPSTPPTTQIIGRVLPSRYPAAVTKKTVPAFSIATVESVAKAVGDLYSGSELTRMLAEVRLKDALGESMTKWKRLATAMSNQQARQGDGRPVVALINAAMAPARTLSRRAAASIARDELN